MFFLCIRQMIKLWCYCVLLWWITVNMLPCLHTQQQEVSSGCWRFGAPAGGDDHIWKGSTNNQNGTCRRRQWTCGSLAA
uniref:Secreted protein n=1 Tax=Setaria viridis TaxID=4556 RepID=A0A4U6SXY9_SETVI|nr:hypothetical protein SEVIR_9G196466v2 [Setaria viridis]